MQQRQLRLGDILDDYCPRERRVTNHAVVAMIGEDVRQTRCTTCEAEHEYKHARVPRQRKKADTPAALTSQILAGAPKRVVHDPSQAHVNGSGDQEHAQSDDIHALAPDEADEGDGREAHVEPEMDALASEDGMHEDAATPHEDEGPIHRRLIRASLPRPDGQQPPARPIPEFTIRQPGGRPNRFRGRHHGGGAQGRGQQGNQGGKQGFSFQGGNRSGNGRGDMRSGRPQGMNPRGHRHGPKRSK